MILSGLLLSFLQITTSQPSSSSSSSLMIDSEGRLAANEVSLLLKLVLSNRVNGSVTVNLSSVAVEEAQREEFTVTSNEGLKVKEALVVIFILALWAYSIYRFFKIWRDILNFSVETLQRSQQLSGLHGPNSLWTIITDYIRTLRKVKSNEEQMKGNQRRFLVRDKQEALPEQLESERRFLSDGQDDSPSEVDT